VVASTTVGGVSAPLAEPSLGASARWCAACDTDAEVFASGPDGRPDARCENCGALERHRFLAHVLRDLAPVLPATGTVVDIAPQRQIAGIIRRLTSGGYVAIDLVPSELTDVAGDITRLPLADDSVDLLVCYHVLEHVPDDATAMRELARVLAPDGLALLQVPWRPTDPTDEDPDAPVEERIERFGQDDHVRYYGYDFDLRLADAGLFPTRFQPSDVVDHEVMERERLVPREAVWLCRTTPGTIGADLTGDDAQASALWRAIRDGSSGGPVGRSVHGPEGSPQEGPDGGAGDEAGDGADGSARGTEVLEVRLAAMRSLVDAMEVEREQLRARLSAAGEQLAATQQRLEEQQQATIKYREAAAQHRAAYHRLAQHPVVRFLVALRDLVRRLIRSG
jgi:SAM-dependent methyltransferase